MATPMPPEPADATIERFLMTYARSVGLNNMGTPPHTTCVKLMRLAFLKCGDGDALDLLETCLRALYAVRYRPRDWKALYWEIADFMENWEYARHKRKSNNEVLGEGSKD